MHTSYIGGRTSLNRGHAVPYSKEVKVARVRTLTFYLAWAIRNGHARNVHSHYAKNVSSTIWRKSMVIAVRVTATEHIYIVVYLLIDTQYANS